MRTDKQLHDEDRAGDDTLSTEDIANANSTMERRADDPDLPAEDMDGRTEDMTVMGTPVNGAESRTDDPETGSEPAQAQEDWTQEDQTQEDRAQPHEDEAPPTVELLASQDVERFRVQWKDIQTRFVDDPREAVHDADQLVAEVMRSLATMFTDHKHDLEGRWQEGNGVDTEQLRQALRHYRSFFDHLLEV